MRSVCRAVAILAVLLAGFGRSLAAPNETKISELAPGVFFRKAQVEPTFTGCNQGWVVFKDYVLVIDANFPGQAEEVIGVIRKTTNKPIRFVFDTHYHGDHADGNQQYEKIGATVVAHERSQPLFQTKGVESFDRTKQDAAKKDEYGPLAYAMPSLYFSHRLVFDDGEQRVELLFLGHAHTAGDAVAWLPRHGILFTGDACVNGAFNYTGDGDTESWISALSAMEDLDPKQVAPGHGELAGKELIGLQKRYFTELRAAVRDAISAGKSVDDLKQSLDLPFYKEWAGVEAKTRTENIEHVFKELSAGAKPLNESKAFHKWLRLPGAGQYASLDPWAEVGSSDADKRWSSLAELYFHSDTQRRKSIRDYFGDRPRDLDEMRQYVRRMGRLMKNADDVPWLRHGLAIAAIEGGRNDYRATTDSLVLLRHGAERAEIEFDRLFREIQGEEFIAPENKLLFESARTRSAEEVAATVVALGPADWAADLSKASP